MSTDIDTVAPDFGTVLFVGCAVLGLVLVATVVPPLTGTGYERSADPSDGFESLGDGPEEQSDAGAPDSPADNANDSEQPTEPEEPANDTSDTPADDEPKPRLTIDLNVSEPTPGTQMLVTVTNAETTDPVAGATVAFGEQSVGTTDDDGTVTGMVPFVEQLTVTASKPSSPTAAVDGAAGRSTATPLSGKRTVETDSQVALGIDGELGPEGRVTISATVGDQDVAIDGATVAFDGETVGQTDANGTLEGEIPAGAETLTITATRGGISDSEQLDLDDVSVSVDSLFPVAGGRTTVQTTVDALATNGTVYVLPGEHGSIETRTALGSVLRERGRSLDDSGTRFYNGRVDGVVYPLTATVTIVVTVGSHAETVVVANLYRNLAVLVLGGLSVGFGLVTTYVRLLGRSPSRDFELARSYTLDLTFSLGSLLFELGGRVPVGRLLRRSGEGLLAGTAGLIRGIVTLRVPSLGALSLPSFSLPSLSAPSLSLPSLSLGSVLTGRSEPTETSGGGDHSATPAVPAPEPDQSTEEIDLSNRQLIWAAWREFAGTVGVGQIETTTPGAVARHARAETEVPADAIDVLTEAVRTIEYGGTEPTDELVEQVLQAIAAVRAAGGDEE